VGEVISMKEMAVALSSFRINAISLVQRGQAPSNQTVRVGVCLIMDDGTENETLWFYSASRSTNAAK
jgi:hypothetical protein